MCSGPRSCRKETPGHYIHRGPCQARPTSDEAAERHFRDVPARHLRRIGGQMVSLVGADLVAMLSFGRPSPALALTCLPRWVWHPDHCCRERLPTSPGTQVPAVPPGQGAP